MLPGFAHTGVSLLGSEGECSEVLLSCGCTDPPCVCRAGHRSSSPGECIEVQVSLEGSMKNACNSHPVPSLLHLAPVIPSGDSFFCENKKSSLLFWKEVNQLPCSWLTTITTMTYFLLSLDKEAPKCSQGIILAGPRKTCVCLCCMYDRTSLTPCGNQNWSPLPAW